MSDITARSIVTLVVFFVVNALVIWPIKIPIPRWVGLAYRALVDGVGGVLGLGPLEGEGRIWGGNSDGTRQNAVGETGVTDASVLSAAPAVPAVAAVPGDPAADRPPPPSSTAVNGSSGSDSTADAAAQGDKAARRAADKAAGVPRHFKLGLVTAPPAGVLLLLASTCITGRTVREGIVADPIRPFDVMILFLSFAYIALSLDQVGLLRYLAFLVAKKATDSSAELETPGATPGPSGAATPTGPAAATAAAKPTSMTADGVPAPGGAEGAGRRKKGKSAQPVFAALYGLFIFISAVAGNDPIVLSGTPFVAYFSRSSGSPAEPYAFMELYAANLASAILVSSNPTNLVLSAAFGLSFLEYSAWMVLPTLAAALVLYPVLALQYRPQLRRAIRPPDVDPRSALVDPAGAVWASVVFILAVVVLVVLSATGQLHGAAGVWSVAAPAALLVALRDMWHDWRHRHGRSTDIELDELRNGRAVHGAGGRAVCDCGSGERGTMRSYAEDENEKDGADDADDADDADGLELHLVRPVMAPGMRRRLSSKVCRVRPSVPRPMAPLPEARAPGGTRSSMTTTPSAPASTPGLGPGAGPGSGPGRASVGGGASPGPGASRRRRARRRHPVHWFRRAFPTVSRIVPRLPFPLVLFALSFFVLVRSLDTWLGIWARWWAVYVARTGLAGAIFLLALLSVAGSNVLGTNIGAAVLLQGVIETWRREHAGPGGADSRVLYASILTLATGCNYGAFSFTFSASLAGLLWKDLLFARGIRVRIGRFCANNLVPLFATMLVSCLVIAAEVCVMY